MPNPNPEALAAVLTRILQRATPTNTWSLTWDELTINATVDITPTERDAIGQATGQPTIMDPYIRGYTEPLPLRPPLCLTQDKPGHGANSATK